MADKTVSTDANTDSNKVVGAEEQTPDQFYTGEPPADEKVDPKHATEGMSSLGYTEASRLDNTAAQQEADRKAAERAASKS